MIYFKVSNLFNIIILDLTVPCLKTPERYEMLSHLDNLGAESVLFGFCNVALKFEFEIFD